MFVSGGSRNRYRYPPSNNRASGVNGPPIRQGAGALALLMALLDGQYRYRYPRFEVPETYEDSYEVIL